MMTWQSGVTLDSICTACDIWERAQTKFSGMVSTLCLTVFSVYSANRDIWCSILCSFDKTLLDNFSYILSLYLEQKMSMFFIYEGKVSFDYFHLIYQGIINWPQIPLGLHNFLCPHVLCENVRPPVSTFPWVRMFMRHLCMYSLGQWSDQRYYVIKHVLSDLRDQPLPAEGNIPPSSHADFGCCRSFSLPAPIINIETPCFLEKLQPLFLLITL